MEFIDSNNIQAKYANNILSLIHEAMLDDYVGGEILDYLVNENCSKINFILFEEKISGFVISFIDESTVNLQSVYILKELRSKGLMKKALLSYTSNTSNSYSAWISSCNVISNKMIISVGFKLDKTDFVTSYENDDDNGYIYIK